MRPIEEFRDTSKLAITIYVFIGFYGLLALLAIPLEIAELQTLYGALDGKPIGELEADSSLIRRGMVDLFQVLAFLTSAVLYMRWLYVSKHNALSLAEGKREYTPTWALLWFIIPIANLWKPYQAIDEVFRESDPDRITVVEDTPTPKIIPWWWLVWVVSLLSSRIATKLFDRADTIEEQITASWLLLAVAVVDVALTILAIIVVAKLTEMQREKREKIARGQLSFPTVTQSQVIGGTISEDEVRNLNKLNPPPSDV